MTNTLTLRYGNGALIVGEGAQADKAGQEVRANGNIATAGDAQTSSYIMRGVTSDANTTSIYLDGVDQKLTINQYSSWLYNVNVVARRTDAFNESAGYIISGVISRDAAEGSTAIVGSNKVVLGESSAAWDANVVADTINGSLNVEVTGENGKSINWVASVNTVETLVFVDDESSSSSESSASSENTQSSESSSLDSSSSESAVVENNRMSMGGETAPVAKSTNTLTIPAGSKSISVWYTQTAHSQNWSPLISSGNGATPYFAICGDTQSSNKIKVFTGTGDLESNSTTPLGQNIHLVAVSDGAITKIYINGALDITAGQSWDGSTGIVGLGWNVWDNSGSGPADTFAHNGTIDEINIWDRELSLGEITSLYNGGSGRKANLSIAPWDSGFNVGWHFDNSSELAPSSIGANIPFDVSIGGNLTYVASDVCLS